MGVELQKRSFISLSRAFTAPTVAVNGAENKVAASDKDKCGAWRMHENKSNSLKVKELGRMNQIMWPKPKVSGCTCAYTDKRRVDSVPNKFLSDTQQSEHLRANLEVFVPVKNSSVEESRSEDMSTDDVRSLKKVKRDTYCIQGTTNFVFEKRDKPVGMNNSNFQILAKDDSQIKGLQEYQMQAYHILSFERETLTNNLTIFKSVFRILSGVFKNSIFIDDIKLLSPESFIVFALICEKKFKISIGSPDDEVALAKLADVVRNKVVNKRPEECKKIVFSYTIKQLKHRLRHQFTDQYRKTCFDEFFYQVYFEEIAKREGIPLEDFYYPIASTKCKKNSAKTINTAYLSNIRKSDRFMDDLKTYIYTQLLKDYSKEIDNKLLDLITRWENEVKRSGSINDIKATLGSYFKGSKSKLPWTIFEVQHAVEKVRSVVY